jgi:hypothetical protein
MKDFLRLIPRLSRTATIFVSLAAVSFVIYLGNFKTLGAADTVPASLLPIVLLTEGRIYFDSYEQHYKDTGNPVYSFVFVHTNRGLVSSYPLATGFLATPIYLIPVLWLKIIRSPTIEEWISFAGVMEKVAAAVIVSISIVVFFYTCRALSCREVTAFWLSAAFAFGTEAWSTSSQALWMHGPGIFFMCLSVLLGLRLVEVPRRQLAVLLGLSCGMGLAIRFNNVLFVGPLLCWILYKQPRHFILTFLSASAVVVPLLAYNWECYGKLTGSYDMAFGTPFLTGLEGVLFSPARGLLIYFPLTLFAIIGLAKAFRRRADHRTLYLVFAVFIATGIVSVSKWDMWWGGSSYGPRLLADIQPFLLLASIPICKTIFEESRATLGVFGFFVLFCWSSTTQFLGAYFPTNWNEKAESHLWDWGDNPIGRSIWLIESRFWPTATAIHPSQAPPAIAHPTRNPDCAYNIDLVNDVPIQANKRTIHAQGTLKLQGWSVVSGKEGITPDEVWIALTQSDGRRHFYQAIRQPRPDVNAYFKQPNMKNPGFVAPIDLTGLHGLQSLDIYQVYDNAAIDCAVNRNIEIQPWWAAFF